MREKACGKRLHMISASNHRLNIYSAVYMQPEFQTKNHTHGKTHTSKKNAVNGEGSQGFSLKLCSENIDGRLFT